MEEAQKALAQRQTIYPQADGRSRARKKNTLLNYAETSVSRVNVEDISLDLDEL